MPLFDPSEYLKAFERYQVNSLLEIPTVFVALLSHPYIKKYDFSNVRMRFFMESASFIEIVVESKNFMSRIIFFL